MASKLKHHDAIVFRKIEEEYILLPLASCGEEVDSLFNLNPTAGAIWERIDGRRSVAEIVDELHAEYDQDRAALEAQVLEFLSENAPGDDSNMDLAVLAPQFDRDRSRAWVNGA